MPSGSPLPNFYQKLPSQKTLCKGLLISFVIVSVVMSLHAFHLFQRNEWIAYDWMIKQKSKKTPISSDIAIVLIDDASLQYMDSLVGRWPWPRAIFAEVIDYVSMGSPKAILFDLLFVEQQSGINSSTENTNSDQRLAEATRNAQNTFHAMQFIADREDEIAKGYLNTALPDVFPSRFALQHSNDTHHRLDSTSSYSTDNNKSPLNNYLIPYDSLYQAAKGIGVVSINEDSDGVLRRTALTHNYQGFNYPALSIAALTGNDGTAPGTPNIQVLNQQLFADNTPIPTDSNGYLYVNMHNRFNTYSMSGLLASISLLNQGEVENLLIAPDEFKDKYVFIGASAIGLHDLKVTPLSNNQPGVMVHASTLANVLQHNFLYPPNPVATFISIIVVSLFTTIGILNSRLNSIKILLPLLVISCLWAWVSWQFNNNQIVHIIPPLVSIALSWTATYFYLHFTEEKEKNKIRQMFSQYVSPAALTVMVDQYENYNTAHMGTKEEVSILFSDIRGFTTISENIEAEVVVEMLNYYFSIMTKAVYTHHGTIDKFIGDAIMAIWGAPIKTEGHASHALHAALEMIKQLDNVNQWLIARHHNPIDIGIGINSGKVILGSIGSEQKADYTVIGDNVNLASRLEGATKIYGCQILLSEYTYAQVEDIPCMIVDLVRVKGRHNPIKLYTPVLNSTPADNNTPSEIALLAQQAFDAYLNCHWKEAIHQFDKLPNRALGQLYVQRCREYEHRPPPQDWDGVYSIISK